MAWCTKPEVKVPAASRMKVHLEIFHYERTCHSLRSLSMVRSMRVRYRQDCAQHVKRYTGVLTRVEKKEYLSSSTATANFSLKSDGGSLWKRCSEFKGLNIDKCKTFSMSQTPNPLRSLTKITILNQLSCRSIPIMITSLHPQNSQIGRSGHEDLTHRRVCSVTEAALSCTMLKRTQRTSVDGKSTAGFDACRFWV